MKMLVVVDYQKDFVDGALGFPGAEKIDGEIAEKVIAYKNAGDIVIQTMDTHLENYLQTREGKHLPIKHCIYGTDGWKTYGDTARAIDTMTDKDKFFRVRKKSFACHPYELTSIMQWMAAEGYNTRDIETIEFVGLVSNICVISNICVFQGAFPDAQIVVSPKLVASFDEELHCAALKVMKGLQVELIDDSID